MPENILVDWILNPTRDMQYPIDIPVIRLPSYADFVAYCMQMQQLMTNSIDRHLGHAVWSEGPCAANNMGYVRNHVIPPMVKECADALMQLTESPKWVSHCAIIFGCQLRASLVTYFDVMYQWNVQGTIVTLKRVLNDTTEKFFGYPDCCWGWPGPGIFQTLLQRNFVYLYPNTNWLVPTHMLPEFLLAFCMGKHNRLGANSLVNSCLDDIIHIIVKKFLENIHFLKYCSEWNQVSISNCVF